MPLEVGRLKNLPFTVGRQFLDNRAIKELDLCFLSLNRIQERRTQAKQSL